MRSLELERNTIFLLLVASFRSPSDRRARYDKMASRYVFDFIRQILFPNYRRAILGSIVFFFYWTLDLRRQPGVPQQSSWVTFRNCIHTTYRIFCLKYACVYVVISHFKLHGLITGRILRYFGGMLIFANLYQF